MTTLEINGASSTLGLCYDGLPFYSASHVEGSSGTQSNLLSVAVGTETTGITGAEAAGILTSAAVKFAGFLDNQGKPMNEGKGDMIVVCPVGYLAGYAAAISSDVLSVGGVTMESNTFKALGSVGEYRVRLFPNARLPLISAAQKTYIHLADSRSFIRQEELAQKVSAKAEGSEFEHDNDAHEYGIMTIRAAGYGNWQSAIEVTCT
jgi:hypothetical protein